MRIKNLFSNPKAKSPGYGISREFYVSVLAAKAQMPLLLQVINPKGEGGAVTGFGVPLRSNAGKEELGEALRRGGYGLASPDRKTVLRMLVLAKEEAGYDPEPVVSRAAALGLAPDVVARLRATWNLFQLTFESFDPAVAPALDFLTAVSSRLAELTEGVVADPLMQTYRLPKEVALGMIGKGPIDARHFVGVATPSLQGRRAAHTLGMGKFALPEFEIDRLEEADLDLSREFLVGLASTVLAGNVLGPGAIVGSAKSPFTVSHGGHDRARWEGVPVLDLLPEADVSPGHALRAWAAERRV